MSKTLTIQGESFEFPEQNDSPGWGASVTAWAEAVNNAIQAVAGPGDILLTVASLTDGQAVAAPINNFIFDTTNTRAAIAELYIHRLATTELVEASQLFIAYKDAGTFEFTQVGNGTSGVTLSIDATGQINYVSTALPGHVSSTIKFRMRALPQ